MFFLSEHTEKADFIMTLYVEHAENGDGVLVMCLLIFFSFFWFCL